MATSWGFGVLVDLQIYLNLRKLFSLIQENTFQ